MTITSFLFGRKPTPVTIANALIVDATTTIVHSRNANPSKYPIEDGSLITDNVQLDNQMLTINGFISEAPLDTLRSLLGGLLSPFIGTEVGGNIAGVATAAVASVTNQVLAGNSLLGGTNNSLESDMKNRNLSDSNFPKKAWRYLQLVQEQRIPFSIVTSFREYDDMVIKSLTQTQSPQDGGSLRFTMTCEQLQIVTTETIQLPENFIEKSVSATGSSNSDLGKQVTTPPSDNTSENGSILFELFN